MSFSQHITEKDKIRDVMKHPAFQGRGKLLFPWDSDSRYTPNMTMRDAPDLHLWHTNMDVREMVAGINRLIDDANSGWKILYDIYTEEEKRKTPSKQNTGLFFLRGKPGAPFAIISPGGGFYYVGSLHEGFPIAMEINQRGYNAFVLNYRVGNGNELPASQDLMAAVRFIQKNAAELGVAPYSYSLWDGSAGARMCSNVSYGEGGIHRSDGLLHPAANIIAYTYFAGGVDFTVDDPPAYFIVGKNDWIVPWRDVRDRAKEMKDAGIDVECHILEGTQHGFGVGNGTAAEGWIDQAIRFWEKRMKKENK